MLDSTNLEKRVKRENMRLLRKRKRAMIDKLKDQPCKDCNTKYPPYVMEFDHIPGRGVKKFNISEAIANPCSPDELMAEFRKCEVVCANCHRERTHGRDGDSYDKDEESSLGEFV